MPFAKATIEPVKPKGTPIEVRYNPTQYTFDKTVHLAEAGVTGLGAPILQFTHGGPRTLTMDLFFDSYEKKEDVRKYTNEIYGLTSVESETHVPAVCLFKWGAGAWGKRDQNSFRCVVERISGKFTLFLADGTPVRAMLTVTFKEAVDVKLAVRSPATASADHTKTRIVKRGDTLATIAATEYGDQTMWRPIADVNRVHNPRRLAPGTVLVIPALDERGQPRR